MYRLDDRWVWDFWFAERDGEYHVFYLQAPRSLGDPELRHRNASVGHAVSADLRSWTEVGTALEPGPPGAWDDVATWTGSVVRHEDRWWMFYTGSCTAEDGLVQRIGAATSDDLVAWRKHPANPLVTADPHWYELLDLDAWHDQAWRDPWVYAGEDGWQMLITARSRSGPADERGVLGRARSDDLVDWTVLPPLIGPGGFGHMEVPQRAVIEGRPVLFFSCLPAQVSRRRLAAGGAPASGCYAIAPDGDATALALPGLYSCRVLRDPEGRWVVMGFVDDDGTGAFAGAISDPLPLAEAAPWLFDR